jgi:3-phenylpropionate/trans-cinnamate dioxygenase ferredoxin reductase component
VADRRVDFLLVGGGIAAASCARGLLENGVDGQSILIVGREADPPYDRPPLSKGYLAGTESRADVTFDLPGDVELLTRTSVMKLDTAERIARLSTKDEIAFDKALLATGANVRRLRADGSDLDGIHYLRAFGNADAIRSDAEDAEQVVLVGGSYIGCEVAATLTTLGKRCTILMQEAVPLEHHFGSEVGRFIAGVLGEHGVEIVGSDELERFEGDGRVQAVVTKGGRRLPCELAVVGVGVMPDTMLARATGLELGERGGIACSKTLESSAPGIFAAGDVAEYDSVIHGGAARVEHWDVAFQHGRTAARNMLGEDVAHDAVPYFWSDMSDWASLEYVGVGGGEGVVRGSVDGGRFCVFYLDDARLVGALSVGRPEDLQEARRMIAEHSRPPTAQLMDEDTDLATL